MHGGPIYIGYVPLLGKPTLEITLLDKCDKPYDNRTIILKHLTILLEQQSPGYQDN
jgi:hypothetical protein